MFHVKQTGEHMELTPFFNQYMELVNQVDAAFKAVEKQFPDCVACMIGCADCCHALFDLPLIEALYIKTRFDEKFDEKQRTEILARANTADRAVYRIKRQAYKAHESGRSDKEILKEMAIQRVRCPALESNDRCVIYDFRPITCRLYGVPTVIGGKAHTCGLSNFEKGRSYPTVKMDAIHHRLNEISTALARDIQSKYPRLAELLVPLSMALLTDYTDDYLGIAVKPK